ncbi:MAG: hypothetical protein WC223_10835 [Bacteroidales bacterium]|jgi:uncharacterized protein YycO
MTINDLITQNGILPADAIIVSKKFLSIFDHYIIYMGQDENRKHWFSANMSGTGVTWISEEKVKEYLLDYKPVAIRKFTGNEQKRQYAVNFAISKIGTPYSLINYNCENYANEVQFRKNESKQVQSAGKFLLMLGAGILIIKGIDELSKK